MAATAGITIDISKTNAQNTGGAGTDKVSGFFENLTGSGFNDVLTGAPIYPTIFMAVLVMTQSRVAAVPTHLKAVLCRRY